MLNGNTRLRRITGITKTQERRIKDFLQGAVYAWCNSNKNKPFFCRDLIGGDNSPWENTPLQALCDNHKKAGKSPQKIREEAGKDAGKLLKAVLVEDENKSFDQEKAIEGGKEISKYWLIS
jgi:hypothetical protein